MINELEPKQASSDESAQGALLREFAAMALELASQPSVQDTLDAIVKHALSSIDGTEDAAIITGVGSDHFRTVAATSTLPARVDAIQHETQQGPCVDALTEHRLFRSDDLGLDPRWPAFGPLTVERTKVVSMLSHQLVLAGSTLGALNLYSREPAAFGQHSVSLLHLYAAHAAIALARAASESRSENLQQALESNRTIGVAVGILMATYKIARVDAFELLRIASQHAHRRVHEIAQIVAETGHLDPDSLRS